MMLDHVETLQFCVEDIDVFVCALERARAISDDERVSLTSRLRSVIKLCDDARVLIARGVVPSWFDVSSGSFCVQLACLARFYIEAVETDWQALVASEYRYFLRYDLERMADLLAKTRQACARIVDLATDRDPPKRYQDSLLSADDIGVEAQGS